MQIVTDRACDLSAEQMAGLDITFAPMRLTLEGKTYSSGVDITSAQFYELLDQTESFPSTSTPAAGDFAEIYRRLAKTDPEILSIHISSGLSGTYNAARLGAEMVPEARVTLWDTKTLSCPEGWQVEAAARALKAGWSLEKIFDRLAKISKACEGMYTLDTLKYLIHGGRISHMKALVASVLHIRPIIGVGKEDGKYYTMAQERTIRRALAKMADVVAGLYPEGTALRVQLLHGKNLDALETLRECFASRFQVSWSPMVNVAPILGAHTGGSLVGMSVGPADLFQDIPGIIMG